ncbi:transcriptional regulator, LacI family [Coriobacterium glomerans PW2]|uniref:Transcriptional regulator, LacI family n=1 Tax=Coriobacterium glomerans (strain ATCC 49209 / DSM 20642 / JCM 10262 / PW2) TaxID=700015 RepID=F2NA50_CORGP|nr:LacI family DNA-binding transcriptional regulator [Coriobacterium glomerans]AEB06444.1 transcriptional regulator, LacI family [Coriobacterium glomerans PW2]
MREKKITIRDIAERSGVSRATVSRYLNGGHWVSGEAAARIGRIIDETGYVANESARSLATGRSNCIAFLLGEPQELLFADANFSTLLRSIADELGRKGMSLIMMTTDSAAESQRNMRFLRAGHVDGVLLVAWHYGARKGLIRALHAQDMPVVVAEYPATEARATSYVHVDDYQGAAEATRYLAARGARRIAMIAGPKGPSGSLDRVRGYTDALAELRQGPLLVERGDYSKPSGRVCAARLLDRDPSIDGLFAASDAMAIGAIQALRDLGRDVPSDVQVVGFDDQQLAQISEPPLTTMRQPFQEIGRRMVDQLIDLIRGGAPVGTTLPLELVVRGSTR